MKISELLTAVSLPPALVALAFVSTAGCENKETLLDVETPSGQVEVEEDQDTGAIDVDAMSDDETLLDSDVPGADVEVTRDQETGDVNAQ